MRRETPDMRNKSEVEYANVEQGVQECDATGVK